MKKETRITRLMSLCIVGVMLLGMLIGCGNNASENPEKNRDANTDVDTQKTDDSETATGGFRFAGDIVGQGDQVLDKLVDIEKYSFESIGSEFQIYNDNFTSDTQNTNIQTMAAGNYDGMMIFGWNATLYNGISDVASQTKTPFIFWDQIPTDENVISQLNENEYYMGCVGVNHYLSGKAIAEAALADGKKTALVLGGSVGDVVQDARVSGFTETFEAGGGQVVGVARCTDSSEATTKEDDMISGNPNVEMTYCASGDYAVAAIAAMENYSNVDMAIGCSDTTKQIIPFIKDGTVNYADGGYAISVMIAATILQNNAMGNTIKDENGLAPNLSTIQSFMVTADNADLYEELFQTGYPLSKEKLQSLVGVGITYQDYVDFVNNFSLDAIAH